MRRQIHCTTKCLLHISKYRDETGSNLFWALSFSRGLSGWHARRVVCCGTTMEVKYGPAYDVLDEAEEVEDAMLGSAKALESLRAQMRQLEAQPQGAMDLLPLVTQKLSKAHRAVREFEVEAADATLSDGDARRFAAACAQHRAQLAQMAGTVEFERAARQREALLQSAHGGQTNGIDPDLLTPTQILAQGEALQVESQLAVARMVRSVESSRQVGKETLVALGAQHERLERLDASTGAMKAQFDMAEREMRTFTSEFLGGDVGTLALLMLIVLSLSVLLVHRLSIIPEPPDRDPPWPDGRQRWQVALIAATDEANPRYVLHPRYDAVGFLRPRGYL